MPKDATTFGDLADAFNRHIRSQAKDFSRVDVVFDRREEQSLKDNTRSVRRGTLAQIRRMITGRDVPLPKNMAQFLDLGENKADLSRFPSEEVLEAEHEVADTRIVLHVIHCAAFYDSIVVRARDTDILLLLVHHYPRFNNKCV